MAATVRSKDDGIPSLAALPHLIASSSSSHSAATRVGSAYKLSSSSTQQRAAVKRIRNLTIIANCNTNTLHLLSTAQSTSAPSTSDPSAGAASQTADIPTPSSSTSSSTLHIPPTQSFSLDPAAGETLGPAAPITTLRSSTRTTYITLTQPQPILRAYIENTAPTSSHRPPPTQSQTILSSSDIFIKDPIESLHLLNTSEIAASHAHSSQISLFQHSPSEPDNAPSIQPLLTWAPPSTEPKSITHHFSLFDSTPALHLLRGTDPSLIQHERVSALAFRIASPCLPTTTTDKKTNGAGGAKGGRKSALQVMDDLHALPVDPPLLDPKGRLRLSTVLIQSRGKDPAAADRVQFLKDVDVPGFGTGDETESSLGALDVLSCTLHPDGNLAILTRGGKLLLYDLALTSNATPALTLTRTIHLNHFHFQLPSPSPSPSSPSKPASILSLSSTHLLLIGLVLPTTSSTAEAGPKNKSLKPRVQAVIFDTALEAVVAETDVSGLLPPHFSMGGKAAEEDPGLDIGATRSAGGQVIIVLNTVPAVSAQPPTTTGGRRSSRGASSVANNSRAGTQYSNSVVLPYTLPLQSSVRHILGRGEMTARWIGRSEGVVEGKKEKRRARKNKGGEVPVQEEKEKAVAVVNGTGNGVPSSGLAPPTLAQLRATSDWAAVLHALRTRPDLEEDELVRTMVMLLPTPPELKDYLRAFLPIPLSRPLVRIALQRHLRLAGRAAGDEVVQGVVVLTEILREWVEEWGRVPLARSGWAEGGEVKVKEGQLPRLDEIVLFVTDLLDTFFPTLLSSSSSSVQAQTMLDNLSKALAAHSAHLNSLSLLLGPLHAFAVLDSDRARSAVESEVGKEEGGLLERDGAVHPALREHHPFSRQNRLSEKKKRKKKSKKEAKKGLEGTADEVLAAGDVQARSMTGGGGAYVPAQDGAGRTKRRMMQEASLLVGEYAVEVLEF
ncbi:hypothetical protein CF326_g3098 [Tilletia indica]|nr:hypothetical protein CF326_g3098 [Tilletia indica]